MSLLPRILGPRTNIFDPFSSELWDPFDGLPIDTTSDSTRGFTSNNSADSPLDWKETPEAHEFKLDVPGLIKQEVKVEVEDDRVVRISGERKKEETGKNDTWHCIERSSGKFMRRFRLPEDAKVDEVRAALEDGVLTVTVPKGQVKKGEGIRTLEISGKGDNKGSKSKKGMVCCRFWP
ncbi:18.1 kDa class I heat shock protein-like [Typha angustifolia]|uniref:18.1 kDa class I heat shock protein-like n=1 Tax=Typha angustifolia TaxID=59011 RepID=UPI003C2D7397